MKRIIRIQWGDPWRFESSHAHHFNSEEAGKCETGGKSIS
jgi:hypothetical protein